MRRTTKLSWSGYLYGFIAFKLIMTFNWNSFGVLTVKLSNFDVLCQQILTHSEFPSSCYGQGTLETECNWNHRILNLFDLVDQGWVDFRFQIFLTNSLIDTLNDYGTIWRLLGYFFSVKYKYAGNLLTKIWNSEFLINGLHQLNLECSCFL